MGLTRRAAPGIVRVIAEHTQVKEPELANSPQARKRARQAERRRVRNAGLRSRVRTHIKKVVAAVDAGDQTAALAAFQAAVPVVDSMVGKGILHKNKAARHKSRLARKLNGMGNATAPA